MLENAQIIWIFQKNILYLPRQKVTIGYPGKFPERASRIRHYPFINAKNPVGYAAESGEQDFIDTTPFQCQRCFLTIRAESREGKTISTLPKRGEHFMLTSCFLYSQLPPNRLVTNLHNQVDL